MKSDIRSPFASLLRSSALVAAALAIGGCAIGSEPTSSAGSDPAGQQGSTASELRQITDQEYVASVRDVLGVTLTGSDAVISVSAPAQHGAFNDAVALDYQSAAQRVAAQASTNLTALLGSEAPTTAQVQAFISTRVSQLWHRPLSTAEVASLTALFQNGASPASGGVPNAFSMLLQAALQAPSFLFR